uniref:C-type lectin domain-containing protein n=1 Tax=Fundulus heteroclitus TaxID=8078 RepID=A0A3Q2PG67_FUNHE
MLFPDMCRIISACKFDLFCLVIICILGFVIFHFRVNVHSSTLLFAASSLAERQFYFVNELKNWTEAQTYCREQHADLVTIRSQENLTTLIDMVKPDEMFAWIGLHKSSWTWVDGSKPLFTLWKTTVPNNGYVCAVQINPSPFVVKLMRSD